MILNNVKRLLQIKLNDNSKDELLSFIVELVLAKVKTFCYIKDNDSILEEYDFNLLIAQIAADIYLSYSPKNTFESESGSETTPQAYTMNNTAEVKSVTVGDYKVEYNVASKSQSYSTGSLSDAISFNLDKYDEELVNFKRIKFY